VTLQVIIGVVSYFCKKLVNYRFWKTSRYSFKFLPCHHFLTEFSILNLIRDVYLQWITNYRPKTGSHRKFSYASKSFYVTYTYTHINWCWIFFQK
jgi:hypothetical protein